MATPSELLRRIDFPASITSFRPEGDIFLPAARTVAETVNPPIAIDTESVYASEVFERESPMGEDQRRELVQMIMALPQEDGQALWRSSVNLQYISDNAATHWALDRVYSGPVRDVEPDEEHFLFADGMLSNLHNAMGSRNRKRIVGQVLRQYTGDLKARGIHDINVLSIAAGSSRAILETAADLQHNGDATFHIRLTDIKHAALNDGLAVASSLGIRGNVEKVRAGYNHAPFLFRKGFRPDLTEAVGIVDYLSDDETKLMLQIQYDQLPEGGAVLFSNVAKNDEQRLLHDVIGWDDMIYREPEQLQSLAEQAGFPRGNITHIPEPLGQCNLLLASK